MEAEEKAVLEMQGKIKQIEDQNDEKERLIEKEKAEV
jgi:hypothetical protein